MSKRAKEAALKAYPPKRKEVSMTGAIYTVVGGDFERRIFQEGYEQAEKDILDDAKQVVASFEQAFKQAEKDLGWISVKDRLPEKDGFYLTCVNQAGVAQCVGLQYFDTNRMKWRDFDEEVREVFIDYWMEIPKLPKEEKK